MINFKIEPETRAKYSIWVEPDDNETWQVCVFDEYNQETDYGLIKGNINTYAEAEKYLQNVIKEHPNILFIT